MGSLPFFSDDEEDSGDSSSQDDDSKAGDSADNDADVTGLLDEQLERRNNAGWLFWLDVSGDVTGVWLLLLIHLFIRN